MPAPASLSPKLDRKKRLCVAVIETPRNSRCKFKFDEESGLFKLSFVLPEGLSFPFAFGFVPSTRAEDGDPIDVLVLFEETTPVGCVIEIRLIGVIRARQKKNGATVSNDRLIGVAVNSLEFGKFTSMNDLPGAMMPEIEEFFLSYTKLRGRKFKVTGRRGPKTAMALVEGALNGSHSR